MRYTITVCLSMLITIGGCSSMTGSARHAADGVKQAASPVRDSFRRVTGRKQKTEIVHWDWTLGIPIEAPRGEVLAAQVPAAAIAQLLPQLPQHDIRLVSTAEQFAGYEVRNIDGKVIDNCADLHSALGQVPGAATNVQIDLAPAGSTGHEISARVDRSTLLSLVQATAADTHAFRVSEGGNPTFVIRDGGVRAEVVVRVQRQRDMVQLVLTAANCWNDEVLLPVEVRCQCGDQPLQCLTVAETLELLYGKSNKQIGKGNPSFAEVSETEDYLLPVNYKRLSEQHADDKDLSTQSPAFASLSGMRYPGPALLGDARALTGIMLQQERLAQGEQSKTGWLIFAGQDVRTAKHVDVSLDLGNGAKTYRFMIPPAS